MLTDKRVKAFVPAADAAAAKKFYGETLGFKLLSEDDYGIEFEMNYASLRVSFVSADHLQPQRHTILGWSVPDIRETVDLLKGQGIVFEKYDFLEQDENNIWTAPGGTQVAWFEDPSGNLLSIDHQA